jgi:hypothetical protein
MQLFITSGAEEPSARGKTNQPAKTPPQKTRVIAQDLKRRVFISSLVRVNSHYPSRERLLRMGKIL